MDLLSIMCIQKIKTIFNSIKEGWICIEGNYMKFKTASGEQVKLGLGFYLYNFKMFITTGLTNQELAILGLILDDKLSIDNKRTGEKLLDPLLKKIKNKKIGTGFYFYNKYYDYDILKSKLIFLKQKCN